MSVIEVTSFKQLFNTLKEDSMREEIIQEQRLRRVIREKLKRMLSQENEQLLEEQRLRKIIRHKLLTEGDVSDMHPHRSTGINVLEDVLKKMITTLRTDYKRLTTSKAQRDSFRAHMLHAVKQSLMPALVNDMYLQDTDTLMAEPTGLSAGDEEAKSPSDEMLADIDDLNLDDIESIEANYNILNMLLKKPSKGLTMKKSGYLVKLLLMVGSFFILVPLQSFIFKGNFASVYLRDNFDAEDKFKSLLNL